MENEPPGANASKKDRDNYSCLAGFLIFILIPILIGACSLSMRSNNGNTTPRGKEPLILSTPNGDINCDHPVDAAEKTMCDDLKANGWQYYAK